MSNESVRGFGGIFPTLGQRIFLDASAAVIGDVTLGDDCSVWPQVSIRGDVNNIRIGARSNVQDGAVLHVTHAGAFSPNGFALLIGNDVTIGHKAILHGCRVEDRVLIGMGAIVMDGAIVESDVIIAAGALVAPGKTLASGYLYKGSPAQPVRALSDKEIESIRYNAAHYVRLKDKYLAEE